jgi:hypothetical protein
MSTEDARRCRELNQTGPDADGERARFRRAEAGNPSTRSGRTSENRRTAERGASQQTGFVVYSLRYKSLSLMLAARESQSEPDGSARPVVIWNRIGPNL